MMAVITAVALAKAALGETGVPFGWEYGDQAGRQ
jgi:hypothetical protein